MRTCCWQWCVSMEDRGGYHADVLLTVVCVYGRQRRLSCWRVADSGVCLWKTEEVIMLTCCWQWCVSMEDRGGYHADVLLTVVCVYRRQRLSCWHVADSGVSVEDWAVRAVTLPGADLRHVRDTRLQHPGAACHSHSGGRHSSGQSSPTSYKVWSHIDPVWQYILSWISHLAGYLTHGYFPSPWIYVTVLSCWCGQVTTCLNRGCVCWSSLRWYIHLTLWVLIPKVGV